MLEHYFTKPQTIDAIRNFWIGDLIESYVNWLHEHNYAPRNIHRRVPMLKNFGDFAKKNGAKTIDDLPDLVEKFVTYKVRLHKKNCKSKDTLKNFERNVKNPIQQMLRLKFPHFQIKKTTSKQPFVNIAPNFFEYLKEERGLRSATQMQYVFQLRRFESYINKIHLNNLNELSQPILSAFITENRSLSKSVLSGLCGALKIFFRYLYREQLVFHDFSNLIEIPKKYRLSDMPRSISWDEVRKMLEVVDRRTVTGKRDFAILLLLVTYGLRAHEIANLTLDDIDWKRERLRVPERKAGHSTAYPLSKVVGEAILIYLKEARPRTSDRHLFFKILAPHTPIKSSAVSCRTAHYLRKADIPVGRPGSHTLRHTCVQRLLDANFSLKTIGDYVGHSSPASTNVYSKVAIQDLRDVAITHGEESI